MKTKIFLLSLAALALSGSVFAQETVITGKDIPAEITQYVTKYFPDQKILQVEKERDDLKISYEVILDNQTKLEFNNKKKITEIDGRSELPDGVIPARVLAYVKANYPNNHITDWEPKKRKQEVELNNDLSLEFTKAGDFLRIDD